MSKLFSPAAIASVNLRNRIIFPSITTNSGQVDNQVSIGQLAYYTDIAAGGVGAVTVEAAIVSPEAKLAPYSLGLWDDRFIPGLSRLSTAIKDHGAAAFIQIAHVGPKATAKINGPGAGLAPSSVPFSKRDPVREMSKEEIRSVINQFVEAAVRAKKAGFDGVELHAAHFYLLSAFLSPAMNKRTDEYGGSPAGRARIVVEIIRGIKEAMGDKYPVICRLNGRELVDSSLGSGIDAAELRSICLELEKAGADALHVSAFSIHVPSLEKYYYVPSTSIPGPKDAPGVFSKLAAEVKEYVRVPVITVGKIDSRSLAEEILSTDQADFVAMGRSLVADADLPRKMAAGAESSPCLACNRCMSSVMKGAMKCVVNALPLETPA